jgi:hypothetical protein
MLLPVHANEPTPHRSNAKRFFLNLPAFERGAGRAFRVCSSRITPAEFLFSSAHEAGASNQIRWHQSVVDFLAVDTSWISSSPKHSIGMQILNKLWVTEPAAFNNRV